MQILPGREIGRVGSEGEMDFVVLRFQLVIGRRRFEGMMVMPLVRVVVE